MSVLARRCRDEELNRERALVAMRDAVVAAITAYMPGAGSSATLEAVDEALAQLVAGRAHHADADEVKARWIRYARCRLIDEHRSADSRYRDATAVDDHAQALAVTGCGDPCDVIEAERQSWRVREIISVLRGEQREWAEAWCLEVLSGSLPAGAQPRGLPDALGWTSAKAEKTAQRARRQMASFVTRRQRGEVCTEQRALLDEFSMASRVDRLSEELDQERFEAIVFHAVGCGDCFATWHIRRRAPLSRPLAIVMLPVDAIVAAAHGIAAKVAGVAAAAATSVLGRLGTGGAAAAGGGAATIGAKTAAVCVGVVCAATAGGELAAVVPPLLHESAPQTREQDASPKRAQTTAEPAMAATDPAANPVSPPPLPATATSPASAEPAVDSRPAAPPPPPPPAVTPGDLPAAHTSGSSTPAPVTSSASRVTAPPPPPPPPPSRPPASSSGGSSCVPGSLGC
jgi:hypothetical protein